VSSSSSVESKLSRRVETLSTSCCGGGGGGPEGLLLSP